MDNLIRRVHSVEELDLEDLDAKLNIDEVMARNLQELEPISLFNASQCVSTVRSCATNPAPPFVLPKVVTLYFGDDVDKNEERMIPSVARHIALPSLQSLRIRFTNGIPTHNDALCALLTTYGLILDLLRIELLCPYAEDIIHLNPLVPQLPTLCPSLKEFDLRLVCLDIDPGHRYSRSFGEMMQAIAPALPIRHLHIVFEPHCKLELTPCLDKLAQLVTLTRFPHLEALVVCARGGVIVPIQEDGTDGAPMQVALNDGDEAIDPRLASSQKQLNKACRDKYICLGYQGEVFR